MAKRKYVSPEGAFSGIKGAPESEFSEFFVQGMANRMAVSFHKYGPVAEAYPKKVNAIASLLARLARYVGKKALSTMVSALPDEPGNGDGNTEWLIDAGNFSMIEFMFPRHPKALYIPTDSKDSPGRVWHDGAVSAAAHGEAQIQDEAAQFYSKRGGE